MIASFEVPEDDIGLWAGLTSACYSIFQCISAIPWGRASDRFGRKPIVLICLVNTMATSLMWGFSTNLPMAMIARALSGAGNGNVGILRTMVAEMCPWRELQPRAFSIMPLMYNAGSVIGPTLGGALANPYNLRPGEHRSNALLDRFPYAAPNLVAAGFFLVGLFIGVLFLKETLESKKDRRDWGLVLGNYLSRSVQVFWARMKCGLSGRDMEETTPLLKSTSSETMSKADDEEASPVQDPTFSEPPKWADIFTKQSILNLATYSLLALHSIGFDQMIPVFLHHGKQDLSSPSVHLPFKFKSGFGATSAQIGVMFTMSGIMNIFFQFVIFPPTAQKLGVLKCMKLVAVTYVFTYLLIPFSVLVPGRWGLAVLFSIWTVKGLAGSFAFPCSTILLTNAATSLRILGTLNGVATSFASIGRALGPTIGGNAFTYGVKHMGFVIFPFWILAAIAALAALPVFFLVEGEGFGAGRVTPEEGGSEDDDDVRETPEDTTPSPESGYGSMGSLSRKSSGRLSMRSATIPEETEEVPQTDRRALGMHVPRLDRQSSIASRLALDSG